MDMEIAINIGWVLLGLTCLYFGAEWLVKGAANIAMMFGLSSLVVGLTIVAFGTSAPELVVSLQSNFQGSGDFALGNVIGSNICNLGLVLAIAGILLPIVVQQEFIKRELPLLVAVSVIFVAVLLIDNKVSRLEGTLFAIGVVAYSSYCVYVALKNPTDPIASGVDAPEEEQTPGRSTGVSLLINLAWVVVGLGVLILGADRLVAGGEFIAIKMGVSEAVIALTLVALGTSLPELATTIVACMKGQSDMAAGNAIGSCLFNILCVIGFTAMAKPVVSTSISMVDLSAMVGFSIATYLLMRNDRELGRLDGVLLLIGYCVYIAYLFVRPEAVV